MGKATCVLVFLVLTGSCLPAAAQNARSRDAASARPAADPAHVEDDPLKLQWFSHAVGSILSDQADLDERDHPASKK